MTERVLERGNQHDDERGGDAAARSEADELLRRVSNELTRRMRAIGVPGPTPTGHGDPVAADHATEAGR